MTSDTGIWTAAAKSNAAAMVISDADGAIAEANQAALNLFGLEAVDIKGRSLDELCALKPDFECISSPFELDGQTWQSVSLQDVGVSREAAEHLAVKLKVEALGELAGNIAHEFNNHLSGASGFAQMALMKADDVDRVRVCLEEIVAATEAGAAQTTTAWPDLPGTLPPPGPSPPSADPEGAPDSVHSAGRVAPGPRGSSSSS